MGWYPATVTAAPASEPVTVAEAKAQTVIADDIDDVVVARFIKAARAHVENYCGTPLASRTIVVKCDSFADLAVFPVVPLFAVSSIAYVDAAGGVQTLPADAYEVRSDGLEASIASQPGSSWPSILSGSRITVTAVVGYDEVPEDIRQAILLLVAHWYENREAAGAALTDIPHGVDSLLVNNRGPYA
jgi:uncharacterized phiE125 gp8 family phage protein